MTHRRKIGLIQTRGIGDIIIALPIAKWFYDRGCDVFWPVEDRLISHFVRAAPYVQFLPLDAAKFGDACFYDLPKRLLTDLGCDEIHTLYSKLDGRPEIGEPALIARVRFDHYKYIVAGVPFDQKWRLSIQRDYDRERRFFEARVKQEPYIVLHTVSSIAQRWPDLPAAWRDGHQIVAITPETDCVFDWLLILERAAKLVLIDSCFANLVDQLGLPNEKYFMPTVGETYTPTQRQTWTTLVFQGG